MTAVEERLRETLTEAAAAVAESDDLFTRVQLSIEDDQRRRHQKRCRVGIVACLWGAVGAVAVATTQHTEGELIMDWWILEALWFVGMVGLALWLGPFIRRFGKSYAADIFRANPRTGKSFIMLMDVAYYLIFFAFILFTVQFEPAGDWSTTVSAEQLRTTSVRVGGILLIVGFLHGLNVLTLPIIGRLLTLNRRLDDQTPSASASGSPGNSDL